MSNLNFTNSISCFSGMSGNTFYGDLFYLDLMKQKWTQVKHKRNQTVPCPRSAHSGTSWSIHRQALINVNFV